jgi:excinuclease ABC subunit B
MRHSATAALSERRDVIIVASVSCIYSMGDPSEYAAQTISLREGMRMEREELIRRLVEVQYERNDYDFKRGVFRVRGDIVEVFPAGFENLAVRVEFFGDEIDRIAYTETVTGNVREFVSHALIYPATHYATDRDKLQAALETIEQDLNARARNWRKKVFCWRRSA